MQATRLFLQKNSFESTLSVKVASEELRNTRRDSGIPTIPLTDLVSITEPHWSNSLLPLLHQNDGSSAEVALWMAKLEAAPKSLAKVEHVFPLKPLSLTGTPLSVSRTANIEKQFVKKALHELESTESMSCQKEKLVARTALRCPFWLLPHERSKIPRAFESMSSQFSVVCSLEPSPLTLINLTALSDRDQQVFLQSTKSSERHHVLFDRDSFSFKNTLSPRTQRLLSSRMQNCQECHSWFHLADVQALDFRLSRKMVVHPDDAEAVLSRHPSVNVDQLNGKESLPVRVLTSYLVPGETRTFMTHLVPLGELIARSAYVTYAPS